jgi:anti-sigma factor RsiW
VQDEAVNDRRPAVPGDDVRCVEFVEVINDYLGDELDPAQRTRMDRHLEGCPGCRAALDQVETMIASAGRLTAADVASLDPLIRDRLTATLRIPRRR